MKILHTESSIGWGGQETRIARESELLQADKHQVLIACDTKSQFVTKGKTSVPLVHLKIGRKNLLGIYESYKLLKSYAPDLLVTHSSTDSWLFLLASFFIRKKIKRIRTRHVSATITKSKANKWFYRMFDHVITTSETIREHVVHNLAMPLNKVTSVPTGTDCVFYSKNQFDKPKIRKELGLKSDDYIIIMVATLRSWKGHRYVIEALSSLPTNCKLLIVGDGPQDANLKKQMLSLGLEERIKFFGHQEDVRPFLSVADVFCQPSTANEGVSQSLLQAASMEKPIITTSVGGSLEVIQNDVNGFVVPIENSNAIKEAVERMLSDKGMANQFGIKSRMIVEEKFSNTHMMSKLKKIYEY